MRTLVAIAAGFTASLLIAGCTDGLRAYNDLEDGPALDVPIDRDTGKPLLDVPPMYRSVGYNSNGPLGSGLSAATEVWRVTGRWYHRTDEAGMAWPADSGMSWDEKYSAWVDQLEEVDSTGGYTTVMLETPWGREIASPRLECAEMAMFLRVTFASWFNLPFFMTGWHSSVGNIHMGHFGVVAHNGAKVSGYPSYGAAYTDHTADFEGMTDAQILAAWPTDATLAARYLTSSKDDHNTHLGEDAYSGAYFDEIFLNKRVGYFLMTLLVSNGSMHLASAKNTWNLEPEAMRPGDLLIQRWQSSGIGHAIVVKEVEHLAGDKMDAEIIYGSMPRIQPKWWNPNISKSYFTSQYSGGPEADSNGTPYSRFGGGLKRWRTPVVKGGRWVNIVPVRDRDDWIGSTDYAQLEARIDELKVLLGTLTPEQERDAILARIEIARDNLEQRPASCTNRQRREDAFEDLYGLMETHFDMTREQVDEEYRELADYVFAELEYNQSMTCCWNSTTPAMYEIVMDYTLDQGSADTCADPVVFKARGGNYHLFADYAEQTGRGHLWEPWSEDESCPQAPTTEDVEATTQWTDWCDLVDEGTSEPEDGCGGVTWEGYCDGDTVVWCANESIVTYECPSSTECGWLDAYDYYWCL